MHRVRIPDLQNSAGYGARCAMAGVAALAMATPALAQDTLVDEAWSRFGEVCVPVLRDGAINTDTIAAQLTPEFRIGTSTDGKRVFVDQFSADGSASLNISQSDLADRRLIICTLHVGRINGVDAPQVARDLRDRIAVNDNVTVSGGEQTVSSQSANWQVIMGDSASIQIEATGLLPSPDFVTQFDVHGSGIAITAIGYVPVTGAGG